MIIGDVISRVRNTVKGVNQDAFLTDRYIYSLYSNYGKQVIKEEADKKAKEGGGASSMETLFIPLPCVDLIDVDKVDACCAGVKTNCTIKRTKDKIPKLLEGSTGVYLRNVGSIDGSFRAVKTLPDTWVEMNKIPSFKYNKNIYYWFINQYIYLPNVEWDAIKVEGIWSDSVQDLLCDGDACKSKQDEGIPFPEYLSGKIERLVLQDLGVLIQIPQNQIEDNKSVLRS